jgi:RHS repeat-associated protein
MPGRSTVEGTPAKEDYTGHERDMQTGLHYAGARYYMAAFGVWNGIDPLAGDYPGWSPYAYVLGNPVNLMDPNGMEPCPYDPDQDCGIIMDELVVEAKRPEKTVDAGIVGNTFFFNSSTRAGRSALRGHLQDSPGAARKMIGSAQFSPAAQQIAMEENIYGAQRQFMWTALRVSLESGADTAFYLSFVTGVGTAAGVGALLLRRGALSTTARNGIIKFVGASSQVSTAASFSEVGLRFGALPLGGSYREFGLAVGGAFVGGASQLKALQGVRSTGLAGPAFRDAATGRFVTNDYGIGRFSAVNGVGASPGVISLMINDN